MKKAPAGGDQAGVSCRTGAGESGARKRPALVKFEPNNFLRLYQTAHSAPAEITGYKTYADLLEALDTRRKQS